MKKYILVHCRGSRSFSVVKSWETFSDCEKYILAIMARNKSLQIIKQKLDLIGLASTGSPCVIIDSESKNGKVLEILDGIKYELREKRLEELLNEDKELN